MRNCSEAQSPQNHRVVVFVFILYFLIVFFGLGGDFWIGLDSLHENEDLMMNFWAIQESQTIGKSRWPLASFGQNEKIPSESEAFLKPPTPVKLTWQGGAYTVEDPTSRRGVGYSFDSKSYINAEFLAWCPSSKTKMPLPMCEVPIEHNWSGPNAEFPGNTYILHVVGKVMEKSSGSIAGLVFDAQGTHALHSGSCGVSWHVRSEKSPARPSGWSPMEEISQIPFSRSLSYGELPVFGDTSIYSRLELSSQSFVRELGGVFFPVNPWDDL